MLVRFSFIAVAVGLMIAAPAAESAPTSKTLLSANGRVGTVYIDRATPADVREAFGMPRTARDTISSVARGQITIWRYACKGASGSSTFFFDATGVLRNFFSRCPSWRTPAGTRVGDRLDDAEDRERKLARSGCGNGVSISRSGRAYLSVWFRSDVPSARARTVAVASATRGVLGC